jgi:hypothetical protein
MNSWAITDDQGHFKLTCLWGDQPGAAVAMHRVVVTDPPLEDNMRDQDQASQERLSRHLASLKNRPIPKQYSDYTSTPLRVEVKPDQKEYEVPLSR